MVDEATFNMLIGALVAIGFVVYCFVLSQIVHEQKKLGKEDYED